MEKNYMVEDYFIMASVRPKYTAWRKVTKALHPLDEEFCPHHDADKIKDNISTPITPHFAYQMTSKTTKKNFISSSNKSRQTSSSTICLIIY